jgi:hypothetical protein
MVPAVPKNSGRPRLDEVYPVLLASEDFQARTRKVSRGTFVEILQEKPWVYLSSRGGFLRMFSLPFSNHVWDSRRFPKHRPLTWFDIQKLYQIVSLLPNIRKFNQESVDFWPGICMGFNVIQQIERCSIKKQDVHSFEIWRWVNKFQ